MTAIPAFLLTKIIGKHLESLAVIGHAAADRRNCDVDGGRMNAKSEARGAAAPGSRIHTWHMEADELWAGDLDWRLPDFFRCISGDVAVDVDDCRGAGGGNVARVGAGIFVFSFDSDDGRGHRL